MVVDFDITKHILVPKHVKLTGEEKQEVLKEYNLLLSQFPMVLLSDAAIQNLKPEVGDIIKIIRDSPTNIKSIFYRVVVHG
jgi:DNA-directed RNA polymerase subunit H (RpoH/RPB5)